MRVPAPLMPRWVRWAAVVAIALVIFSYSILIAPPEPPVEAPFRLLPVDKWQHLIAYAALAYALAYASTDWSWPTRRLIVFVIGVTVLYGVGIELGQGFTADRVVSVGDAYANALGGLLVIPYYLLEPYVRFQPLTAFFESPTE